MRTLIPVAPVTTTIRGIPVEVSLGTEHGMPRTCVVNGDNLTTIPKVWLKQRITTLTSAKLDALNRALRFALAL